MPRMPTRIYFNATRADKVQGVNVTESAEDVAGKFAAEAPKAVQLTDQNGNRPVFVNLANVTHWSEVSNRSQEVA
jgi:hypothetical protein